MISIHQLQYRMKGFQLQVNNLELMPGLTLLVGKNGSGKSTLLKLLATAVSPQQGEIVYDGDEAGKHAQWIRSRIGYVPSHVELYGDMNPEQLLKYFAQLKGIEGRPGENPVDYWMDRLEISKFKHKKLKKCSLGMQHRVLFAQALLSKPRYLLLDEPLNYLDQRERERMMDILAEMSRYSLIIVASHELNEWQSLADRIIWLDQGEVRFEGSPSAWVDACRTKIWEGWIDAEDAYSSLADGLVACREKEGRAYIVWIGDKPPLEGLTNKNADLEEAYLVRNRYKMIV